MILGGKFWSETQKSRIFAVDMQIMEQLQVDFKQIHAEAEVRHVRLDSLFFEQLDQDEINGGEVDVELSLKEEGDVYVVGVRVTGHVVVPCDRCMANLELPVSCGEVLKFRYGSGADDADGEYEWIHDLTAPYDLSWTVYEIIAVSLPVSRTHDEADCDETMMTVLRQYRK